MGLEPTTNSADRLAAKKEHDDSLVLRDYERIKQEYIDAYEDDDRTWIDCLDSKEKDDVLFELLEAGLIPLEGGPTCLQTCQPYYEKVAKRLAQDRIDTGDY